MNVCMYVPDAESGRPNLVHTCSTHAANQEASSNCFRVRGVVQKPVSRHGDNVGVGIINQEGIFTYGEADRSSF